MCCGEEKTNKKEPPPKKKKKLARNTQKRELIMQAFLKAVREKQIFLESHASRLRTCTLFPSFLFFFFATGFLVQEKKKSQAVAVVPECCTKTTLSFLLYFHIGSHPSKAKNKRTDAYTRAFPPPFDLSDLIFFFFLCVCCPVAWL